MSFKKELTKSFLLGLRADVPLTVSQWADKYRILPNESSSEPGKYKTDRMPYLEEIAYHLSPQSSTTEITVIKGTQLGFTELGNNMLFCYADFYPCPMLQILPTEDAVRKHSNSKIWTSINASSRLKKIFRPKKTKDGSSMTEIKFKGGDIILGWGNSPSTFASSSRRVVICDDVDRWAEEIEGGDPLDLAKNRAEGFPHNKKIYYNSSPAKKEKSKIYPKYLTSSQAVYTMKCPYCGADIVFEKAGFKFEYDEDYQLIGDVVFICESNGCIIEEFNKYSMMLKENGAKFIHKFPHRQHKGYRVPSYYSPFAKWNEIFQTFLDARKEQKNKKSSVKMASWTNTKDANVWEEEVKKIEITDIASRLENYKADVPIGAFILTAGVDTQPDRLEVEIVGWGKFGESWSITKIVLDGDPKYPNVWNKLDKILTNHYLHESGIHLKISALGIDSGGDRTDYVYAYCKSRVNMGVYCLKGDNKLETPIINPKLAKAKDNELRLYLVGVNSAKDLIYSQLTITEPGAGYMHFPNRSEYNENHFNQLTAEVKDTLTGRYKKIRARNEALDIRVYAIAALRLFENQYFPTGIDWDLVEQEFNSRVENNINKKIEQQKIFLDDYSDNWRELY